MANICRTDELRAANSRPIQSDMICGAKVTTPAHNGKRISATNLSDAREQRADRAGAIANDRAKAGNITPEIAAGKMKLLLTISIGTEYAVSAAIEISAPMRKRSR